MIDFRTFESMGKPVEPEYLREPQGMMKRSAAVKVWDKIGVGNSKISGKGVFCVDYIKEGEIFEIAPLLMVPIDEVRNTTLMDYVFKINDETYAVAFGNVSLYNHRNQPSAKWKIDEEKQQIILSAVRDIEPGEEVFISYGKRYWQTRDVSAKTSPNISTIKK
jgi:SET domain-containing protein